MPAAHRRPSCPLRTAARRPHEHRSAAARERRPGPAGIRVWQMMSRCRWRTGEAIAARRRWCWLSSILIPKGREGSQQGPCHPATSVRPPRWAVPVPQGPQLHAARAL